MSIPHLSAERIGEFAGAMASGLADADITEEEFVGLIAQWSSLAPTTMITALAVAKAVKETRSGMAAMITAEVARQLRR